MLNEGGALNDVVIQLKESFRNKLRYHCAVAMRNRISIQQFSALVGELTYADAIVMAHDSWARRFANFITCTTN